MQKAVFNDTFKTFFRNIKTYPLSKNRVRYQSSCLYLLSVVIREKLRFTTRVSTPISYPVRSCYSQTDVNLSRSHLTRRPTNPQASTESPKIQSVVYNLRVNDQQSSWETQRLMLYSSALWCTDVDLGYDLQNTFKSRFISRAVEQGIFLVGTE